MSATSTPLTVLLPCDRGMPTVMNRSLHHFERNEHGVCCRLCGAIPTDTQGGRP